MLLGHGLVGAVLGYAVLHPLSRVVEGLFGIGSGSIAENIRQAFSAEFLAVSVYFSILGCLIGLANGLYLRRIFALLGKLRAAALSDDLTGVYSRRFLMSTLAAEMERARRYPTSLSIIVMDLDHFTQYNYHHGHVAGDRLLRAFAREVKRHLRASDFFGRYGGDEFVVVAVETPGQSAAVLADKICRDVWAGVPGLPRSAGEQNVTVSAGVAAFVPDRFPSVESLIRAADQALYQAKYTGRNKAVLHRGPFDVGPPGTSSALNSVETVVTQQSAT
jgi:diguanylate cyclase (GGDEF)-like protein